MTGLLYGDTGKRQIGKTRRAYITCTCVCGDCAICVARAHHGEHANQRRIFGYTDAGIDRYFHSCRVSITIQQPTHCTFGQIKQNNKCKVTILRLTPYRTNIHQAYVYFSYFLYQCSFVSAHMHFKTYWALQFYTRVVSNNNTGVQCNSLSMGIANTDTTSVKWD